MTQAEKNVGIRELVEAMENHRRFLAQLSPELAPKKKAAFHDEVKDIVLEAFGRQIEGVLEKDKTDGPKKNPYQMAQELLKKISFH